MRGDRPGGNSSDHLTPAQAATILGVSTASVRIWATQGRLSYTETPGGHRRFLRTDVLELASRRGGSAIAAPPEGASTMAERETVWMRAIAAALRAAAADLGPESAVGEGFAAEADRLDAPARDGREGP